MVNHWIDQERADVVTLCREYSGALADSVSTNDPTRVSCPECISWLHLGLAPDPDPVNKPDHYRWLPGNIEVIDITENLGFCLGNVIKYVLRADHKGKPIEDLEKARWYLDRELERRAKQ